VMEEEFAELYVQMRERIFRHARARLRSKDLALDVVSETFRIAWEKQRSLTSAWSPNAYVFGIGKKVTLRVMHDQRRRDEQPFDDDNALQRSPGSTVDHAEQVLDSQRGCAIYRQLARSDRRLLDLMTTPDLEARDVAAILHLKQSAYAMRVHRVRKRIQALIQAYDHVDGGAARSATRTRL
jgi:RNA polymerase sigma-70 factor, ECF subfamily